MRFPPSWQALVAFLAVSAGATACPGSESAALAALARNATAVVEHSYTGEVSIKRGAEQRAVRISMGPGLFGGAGELPPGRALLAAATGDCTLSEYYRVRFLTPGAAIAGRETERVLLAPRDVYRYGHVLDIDRDTGLVLGATTFATGSRALETFRFTELTVGSGGPRAAGSRPLGGGAPAGPEGVSWEVAWLPPGFVATEPSPSGARRRSYTDGVVAFSVFLEPAEDALRPGEGLAREGSTLAYTRGRRFGTRSTLVSVVGEVPENTARMVADSVDMAASHAD